MLLDGNSCKDLLIKRNPMSKHPEPALIIKIIRKMVSVLELLKKIRSLVSMRMEQFKEFLGRLKPLCTASLYPSGDIWNTERGHE